MLEWKKKIKSQQKDDGTFLLQIGYVGKHFDFSAVPEAIFT